MPFAIPNWGLPLMISFTSPSEAANEAGGKRPTVLRKDLRKNFPVSSETADPAEIARFNALAEEWWKPDGAFKTVHAFNRVRVAHLSGRLPVLLRRDPSTVRPLADMNIIDVGCGAGLVTEPMSCLGAAVLGIDAAERNIMVAERHARSTRASVQYRHALPEEIAEEGRTFNAVLSLEVVEHVADLKAFLEALARLVAPGGILVIGTLNRTIRSFAKAIIGAEYVLGWLPRGTHDWRKFVTPEELDLGLGPYGLTPVERTGVSLNPFSMRWAISKDDSATYLQFYRKVS
jgi:2-polyprenyl-6-hydroxyphenyl methylase / 3-demethylubiquinone-9 3-methyltransferase